MPYIVCSGRNWYENRNCKYERTIIFAKGFIGMMKKYMKLRLALFLLIILMVFVTDDMHQRELSSVASAHKMMNEGRYTEALEIFELYLRHSSLYFVINDLVNGKSSFCSYDVVTDASETCRSCIWGKEVDKSN